MGQLAGPGHFAGAKLVHDLARLRVTPLVDLGCLASGQDLERLDRQLGPEGGNLVGREDRVAAEQRREPRHAGSHVSLAMARTVVHQEAQVRKAAADREIEQLIVGLDARRAARPGSVGTRALVIRDPRRRREELGWIRRLLGHQPGIGLRASHPR